MVEQFSRFEQYSSEFLEGREKNVIDTFITSRLFISLKFEELSVLLFKLFCLVSVFFFQWYHGNPRQICYCLSHNTFLIIGKLVYFTSDLKRFINRVPFCLISFFNDVHFQVQNTRRRHIKLGSLYMTSEISSFTSCQRKTTTTSLSTLKLRL